MKGGRALGKGKANRLELPARTRHDGDMNRPELHVLTDPALVRGRPLEELVEGVLAGGADVIQLRDKQASPEEIRAQAIVLLPIVRAAGARLLVNDHWEIARDVGADGVHLGATDAPVAVVRGVCPRPFRIGASARTIDAARRAAADGADYLGTGPVHGTASKADAPGAIGLARLSDVAAAVAVPVIGIGGITDGNAADVVRAGAAGVAVLSAVMAADDPAAAARALRRALDGAKSPPVAPPRRGC